MISSDEIDNTLNTNDIVLIKFSATWCDSCKKYDHYINDLKVYVLNIDYDLNEDLVEEYSISKLPTVLIYKNKNLMDKIEGFITKTEFVKKMSNLS
jgi:thioredoxin 1